jgi:hypothetical protein
MLLCILAAWAVAFLFQLGDLAALWLEHRNATTIGAPRMGKLFWVVPFVAVVLVLVGIGVDAASRLWLDEARAGQAAIVALAAAVVLGGSITVLVVARPRPSTGYHELSAQLRTVEGLRVTRDDIAEYRVRLDTISRRTASRGTRIWRILPVLVAATALVIVWVEVAARGGSWWHVLVALLMPLSSLALLLVTTRLATSAARNLAAVDDSERALALELLDGLERRSVKRVAGLGDRVSRALQILREQQG